MLQWQRAALAIGALAVLATPAPAGASDEGDILGISLAADASAELWPLEITCEITSPLGAPLPAKTLVVPDGHELVFDRVIRTPVGERRFALEVTGRHHPDRTVELEWELRVSEARYQFGPGLDGWKRYALHRVGLGPRPDLGPRMIRKVKADIIQVREDPFEQALRIGAETYRIRLGARSTRG